MNKFKISAILCAAGQSTRMGEKNKLLLPIGGRPLINHTIDQLLGSEIIELIVVIGHEADDVSKVTSQYVDQIKMVYNPDFISGQTSTIKMGVLSADNQCDAYMICLTDLPLLRTDHYDAAIQYYYSAKERYSSPIIRPMLKDKPGHPVIMDHSYRSKILSCLDQEGCRSVIKKNKTSFQAFMTDDKAYIVDIDLPEDYAKVRAISDRPYIKSSPSLEN